MKEIGHISYHYWPIKGGQEVYIDNLIKVLKRNEYDSRVYQPYSKECKNIDNIIPVFNPGLLEILLDKFELWYWGWHIFTRLLKFTKRKQLREDDIIICHYAVHAPAVWEYTDKTIVLSHGIEWSQEEQKTKEIVYRERVAEKAFDRFVTVANDTEYFRYFGLDIKPAQTFFQEVAPGKWFIPNCVDIDLFKKDESIPEFKSKWVILVPRVITRDRGIDLAIKAFDIVHKKYPKTELCIVGGPLTGTYYEYCYRLADRLGIIDKVCFIGEMKHDDMPAVYSGAMVTVIPTLRREGTSLSAIESMACGTATVSTNVGGLKDLPTIQSNPDADDLAEKIIYTLDNICDVSKRQEKIVREIFNYANWEQAWLSVIKSLL